MPRRNAARDQAQHYAYENIDVHVAANSPARALDTFVSQQPQIRRTARALGIETDFIEIDEVSTPPSVFAASALADVNTRREAEV